MALANALVYGGQLLAGSPAAEAAQLVVPRPQALQQVRLLLVRMCGCVCRAAWVMTCAATTTLPP
jgi:hypothetical protein